MDRCGGRVKSCDFWPTIWPVLTNMGNHFNEDITLTENVQIIIEREATCEKLIFL